jgi:hypothetical protein
MVIIKKFRFLALMIPATLNERLVNEAIYQNPIFLRKDGVLVLDSAKYFMR